MEYKLIEENMLSIFEREVNTSLEEGWKLHGNTSIISRDSLGFSTTKYAQAMTREKQTKVFN